MPLVETGGVPLFYQEAGSGPPVLWLPGLGADHAAWGGQTAALRGRYRCIAVDNRDCGRSGRATARYGIRDMAADTVGLLDALGIDSAPFVGWSMGGAIAQELALSWPDRVSALVLLASYDEGDPRADDRFALAAEIHRVMGYEAYLRFSHVSIFTHRAYLRPGFIEGTRRRAMEYPYKQSVEDYERQMDAVLRHDARSRLGKVRCPTLVLGGAEDTLTPVERFSVTMAAAIPGARLEVIPEVGHALLWEQPEATTAAIAAFLDALGPDAR